MTETLRHRYRWPLDDGGSVLALVPACFLVLVVLGALAVDSASAYQAQRQLHDALAAAAANAASAGLDSGAFYSSGSIQLDPAAAASELCSDVRAGIAPDLHDLSMAVVVQGQTVSAQAQATVDAVFGRAIPGFGTRHVSATAGAVLASGPGGPPTAARSSVIHC